MDPEAIAARLKAHASFFDAKVDLIPAKHYVPLPDASPGGGGGGGVGGAAAAAVPDPGWNRFYYNPRGAPPRQEIKLASKKVRLVQLPERGAVFFFFFFFF